ncbi:hypothetical protein OJF2_67870 [Aquisphaera giovannonii]|uniref:Chromosome partition protein Smc n=1 Tax=Aquisphaera giovannonii TaxID=406548 RepID=A0A5B9WD81_9BACT|nr:hypothetical protein [Aquisphaera giovannonii]QEH38189.1 hypothetical protein OJF2_67870 [Aquisphaera giovannonii]
MARADRLQGRGRLALAAFAALLAAMQSGCTLATRAQVEECRRFSQDVRTENARLKDEVLALRTQNEEYAERAVDDGKRLAQLEQARRQLESSVMAYQDQKSQLESAFRQLRDSIPGAPQTQLSLKDPDETPPPARDTPPPAPAEPRSRAIPRSSPSLARSGREDGDEADPIEPADDPPRSRRKGGARSSGGWLPSRSATRPPRDEDAEGVGKP